MPLTSIDQLRQLLASADASSQSAVLDEALQISQSSAYLAWKGAAGQPAADRVRAALAAAGVALQKVSAALTGECGAQGE